MAKEREKARKAQAAAARQELKQRARRNALIRRVVLALVVLGAAGAAGYWWLAERQFTAGLVTASYPAAQHLPGPLSYRETPPLGGPHNVVWQTCGIYTVPIHNEHAVHALEHGAVWITYRPDLASADVQRLQGLASDDYMLLSPYPGLPAPVVASAWNHQMRLTGADDPRLPAFIRRFKNNPDTTPEFGASCLGGTPASARDDSLNTGSGPMVP
jgi:hypothetical protein